MNYSDWEQAVPAEIKGDTVWRTEAYRLALFAADLAWRDATRLVQDNRIIGVADQLYRSTGALSADIEEGYSRGSGRDRARFYEYGLGSAREARGWYYKGRFVLGDKVANHRIGLFTQIAKLLLKMIPDQRGQLLREQAGAYQAPCESLLSEATQDYKQLLELIPMP